MKPTNPSRVKLNESSLYAQNENPLTHDRLIRLPEVLCMIPVSRAKFYLEMKKGNYPSPKKIGSRIAVWRYSAICNLANKIAG
jgi:predicted DNA-binding transcriptional regulator AlpA